MKGFFHPRSVAVIGVSPRRGNLGRNIMGNLEDFGFAGPVYPVSPRGGEFNGRTIYTDVRELPEAPELAVVLTPAASVPGILEACGEKGIKRVIIETAGFSELAAEGLQAERGLLATAEKYGMRFVGPNCLGIICTASGLATPFARLGQAAPRGGISIASQSGGVGLTYVQHSLENGLGLANFASVGNKLNVNEQDILAYFIEDPHTEIILLHLESIVAGREIFDLIRSTDKPVVVHKSNIGDLSRGIAQSHTAALANDDAVVDAALEQAGAVRARSITDCQEILKGLSLPRAKGRRIAVISRSGGHAVVAADAACDLGMELPPFPDSYLKGIQDQTRASVIKLQNPLDLGDLFDFGVYVGILQGALELDEIDGVLFVHVYGGVEVKASREFAVKAGELSRQYGKPVAMVLINGSEERHHAARIAGMPTFRSPHEAMLALSAGIPAKKARPGGRLACADPLDQERAERILLAAGKTAFWSCPRPCISSPRPGFPRPPLPLPATRTTP